MSCLFIEIFGTFVLSECPAFWYSRRASQRNPIALNPVEYINLKTYNNGRNKLFNSFACEMKRFSIIPQVCKVAR